MNNITIFTNPQFGEIRTAGTADEPLFCAVDIARALGYANPAKAVIDHCKGVTILETPTNGGVQSIKFIKESDAYRLIFKSNAPMAEKFNSWLAEEVIPSIRKHGMYATAKTIETILSDPDSIIRILNEIKKEREMRNMAESKAAELEEVTREQAPKVVFANAVAGSTTSILIGELAKLIRQNGVEIGEKRLFEWMRRNGYLGTTGEYYNVPNQRYIAMGLFTLKTNTFSVNGEMKTRNTTKVTGKGQQYFINKFLGQ